MDPSLSGSTMLVKKASKTFQQTTKADDFVVTGILRVKIIMLLYKIFRRRNT